MLMKIFDEAFAEFLERERANIINDISERNLCGRLMLYLDSSRHRHGFHDYYTDTEYNRNKGDIKRVIHDRDNSNIITCDLILHSRGRLPDDNLIAIEMKKKHHKKSTKNADRRRLIALTRTPAEIRQFADMPDHVYDYKLGLFIELDTNAARYVIEVYERGKQVLEREAAF
jgi:hypothetical protein